MSPREGRGEKMLDINFAAVSRTLHGMLCNGAGSGACNARYISGRETFRTGESLSGNPSDRYYPRGRRRIEIGGNVGPSPVKFLLLAPRGMEFRVIFHG